MEVYKAWPFIHRSAGGSSAVPTTSIPASSIVVAVALLAARLETPPHVHIPGSTHPPTAAAALRPQHRARLPSALQCRQASLPTHLVEPAREPPSWDDLWGRLPSTWGGRRPSQLPRQPEVVAGGCLTACKVAHVWNAHAPGLPSRLGPAAVSNVCSCDSYTIQFPTPPRAPKEIIHKRSCWPSACPTCFFFQVQLLLHPHASMAPLQHSPCGPRPQHSCPSQSVVPPFQHPPCWPGLSASPGTVWYAASGFASTWFAAGVATATMVSGGAAVVCAHERGCFAGRMAAAMVVMAALLWCNPPPAIV